jgi:hypothetical protein
MAHTSSEKANATSGSPNATTTLKLRVSVAKVEFSHGSAVVELEFHDPDGAILTAPVGSSRVKVPREVALRLTKVTSRMQCNIEVPSEDTPSE